MNRIYIAIILVVIFMASHIFSYIDNPGCTMPSIVLYSKSTCPYCQKVFKVMDKEQINIPVYDIGENPAYREKLQSIGGKVQVPCLIFDDSKALYESNDIIEYLLDNKDKLS